MFLLDKPYVSKYLEDTALKFGYPVLESSAVDDLKLNKNLKYFGEEHAINLIKEGKELFLYSNSENSIDWISKNLDFTDIPRQIALCKDKFQFRKLISKIYPNFYFEEIHLEKIGTIDPKTLKFPLVLKPKVGFLSFGVYPVYNENEWQKTITSLKDDIKKYETIFPKSVVNTSCFIIEEMIEGDEFAVDVYFDSASKPVILNIYRHPFLSKDDVSDRLYFTSKKIIKEHLENFTNLFEKIGVAMGLKNFPCHIELCSNENAAIPIEINPMRFAGWCLCDLAHYAFDINPYVYYFEQKRPEWDKILSKMDDSLYCFTIGDNQGIQNIKNVDYEAYASFLTNPDGKSANTACPVTFAPLSNADGSNSPCGALFELRKIDYKKFPIFALALIKLPNEQSVHPILKADFGKFIKI